MATNNAWNSAVPVEVTKGGTGLSSTTAYAVICGGTTGTTALQSIVSVGTAGQALLSAGPGALPSFGDVSGVAVTSITGDGGGGAQQGAISLSGGTTGLSYTGAAGTITSAFAGITANAGVVSLGTDATDNAINIGTAASSGRTISLGNTTGTSSLTVDCGTGGVSIGASATAHTTTLGSINSSSDTVVQSGTGGIDITGTNGPVTIISGTGQIDISNDATATTINIATGAGAKNVTIGSNNTSSSLDLVCGTGDFSVSSNTGTIISAADTGEINYPLQPAFFAVQSNDKTNETGDGTQYTLVYNSEIFDTNGDFDSPNFTAPVTGRYQFSMLVGLLGLNASVTDTLYKIITSNRTYNWSRFNPATINVSSYLYISGSYLADMDAGDTAYLAVSVSGTTKTVGMRGGQGANYFSGYLVG